MPNPVQEFLSDFMQHCLVSELERRARNRERWKVLRPRMYELTEIQAPKDSEIRRDMFSLIFCTRHTYNGEYIESHGPWPQNYKRAFPRQH